MGDLERRIKRLEHEEGSGEITHGWGESAESINHRFREWVESDPLATTEELDAALREIYRIYGVEHGA